VTKTRIFVLQKLSHGSQLVFLVIDEKNRLTAAGCFLVAIEFLLLFEDFRLVFGLCPPAFQA
jgi:hypothetical protein